MKQPREIWVASRALNVPAHRIPEQHIPAASSNTTTFRVVCPPGVAYGGHAITRDQATVLRVFPCVRCFEITPPSLAPLPEPADAPPVPTVRDF